MKATLVHFKLATRVRCTICCTVCTMDHHFFHAVGPNLMSHSMHGRITSFDDTGMMCSTAMIPGGSGARSSIGRRVYRNLEIKYVIIEAPVARR